MERMQLVELEERGRRACGEQTWSRCQTLALLSLGMGCVRVAGSCLKLCWGAAGARRRVVGPEDEAGSQKVP